MSHLMISGSSPSTRYREFAELEDKCMDTKSNITAVYAGANILFQYEPDLDDVSFYWNSEVVTRGKALELLRGSEE